jgi:hypothetical protein
VAVPNFKRPLPSRRFACDRRFYRKVWAQGGAGAVVTLELSRNDETRRVEIRSMNRLDHLRLKSSL